ncbi:MAG: hypothetical protein ABSE82_16280 [Nitrososphaerales archaeon]|jgi:hypothetical protein
MVDATTLIVISTVVQTIVISVTLFVFVLQFRSQEKAVREASYQGLMGRYNDFMSTLVENPELTKTILENVNEAKAKEISKEDASIYAHLLLAYGIVEEAYLLYKKKWIDEETWRGWSVWLEGLASNPLFQQIHCVASGTFDKGFEEYVSKFMPKEKS